MLSSMWALPRATSAQEATAPPGQCRRRWARKKGGDTDAVAWEGSGVVLVPPAFASMGDAYEVLTPRAEEH